MSPPPLVFVGGTGRSGTHVVADLLGHHSTYAGVPIECRFHCNPKGLADVVTGRATPQEFVTKLRRYWWHRVRMGGRATTRLRRLVGRDGARLAGTDAKVRGLHKILSEERFESAVAAFERDHSADLEAASRKLFYDFLEPIAAGQRKPALVEMSCFTIAAAEGLGRIFPEAAFVHSVRDGRDSGSSKVSKRQKSHHPVDAASGVEWWQGRLALAERGYRGLGQPDRLHVTCLDELVWGDREPTYEALREFLGLSDEAGMRSFFEQEMNAGAAHRERWRDGLTEPEQEAVERKYAEALDRIEAEGYHCAEPLRRNYRRTAVPG